MSREFRSVPDTTIVGQEHAGNVFNDYLFLMVSCWRIVPTVPTPGGLPGYAETPLKRSLPLDSGLQIPAFEGPDLIPETWIQL